MNRNSLKLHVLVAVLVSGFALLVCDSAPGVRAYAFRTGRFTPEETRAIERGLFAAPWLRPDPSDRLDQMSVDQISAARDEIPPGVLARHRSSVFYPTQIPDLIG